MPKQNVFYTNMSIKLLICIILITSCSSTKIASKSAHCDHSSCREKILTPREDCHQNHPSTNQLVSKVSLHHSEVDLHNEKQSHHGTAKLRHRQYILKSNSDSIHSNANALRKILMGNSVKQETDSKEDFKQVYANTQNEIIDAHADLKRRTRNTLENINTTVEGEFRNLGKEINLYIEEVENKIKEQQALNDEALARAVSQVTAELDELENKLKEQEDRVREINIFVLRERLKEVQDQLQENNKELDQIAEEFHSSKFLCKGYTECSQCTRDPNCGWCLSEEKCVEGNEKSSLNEYCAVYDYNICSGSGCSSKKSCNVNIISKYYVLKQLELLER